MPTRLLPLALLLVLGCKKAAPAAPGPASTLSSTTSARSEALQTFFERVHAEDLAADPVKAAYLGQPHDDTQWSPLGEEGFAAERDRAERWLAELDALPLDVDALADQDRLSVALFRAEQQRVLDGYRWRNHAYPMTHISGTHTWVPSFLMTVHRIRDRASAQSWIARVRNAGPLLDTVREQLVQQGALGVRPPAYTYPQMLQSIDNLLAGQPFADGPPSPLLAHFDRAIGALDLDAADAAGLREEAVAALRDDLGPAYQRMREQLVADAATVTDSHGAWALPDGAAYYAFALQRATTTDLSPAQIHQLGLDEVARIQDEMRALMPALGVEGELQDLYAHLREHPAYTLPDTEAGRAAYLAQAEAYVAGMQGALPQVFEHLPAQPLEVRRVEPWREAAAGKAFYQPPAPDGSRPGIFYANLARMADMPTYQLEALVYHEGIPGHHMQNAVSQTLDDLPPFRRFGRYTAYGEGWGLYSELLPRELGFYEDPASDVGRLAMELWRAARLVVDTGIHDQRWTREQAIEYLVTQTPNPRGDAVKAIERYMVWPGQATAYKVGMLEIVRLRERARATLGDAFDLRGFHGVVLGVGPVPLEVLDAEVAAWTARRLAEGAGER